MVSSLRPSSPSVLSKALVQHGATSSLEKVRYSSDEPDYSALLTRHSSLPRSLVAGLITIAISFFCFFCVPTGPSDAYFLTTEERLLAVERLGSRTGAPVAEISPAQKRALTIKAFTSIPTWLCAWGYLATNVSVQGVSLFLPTIIRALYPGMSTVQIQLRTVSQRLSRRV